MKRPTLAWILLLLLPLLRGLVRDAPREVGRGADILRRRLAITSTLGLCACSGLWTPVRVGPEMELPALIRVETEDGVVEVRDPGLEGDSVLTGVRSVWDTRGGQGERTTIPVRIPLAAIRAEAAGTVDVAGPLKTAGWVMLGVTFGGMVLGLVAPFPLGM